jgi:hypothetical protein
LSGYPNLIGQNSKALVIISTRATSYEKTIKICLLDASGYRVDTEKIHLQSFSWAALDQLIILFLPYG